MKFTRKTMERMALYFSQEKTLPRLIHFSNLQSSSRVLISARVHFEPRRTYTRENNIAKIPILDLSPRAYFTRFNCSGGGCAASVRCPLEALGISHARRRSVIQTSEQAPRTRTSAHKRSKSEARGREKLMIAFLIYRRRCDFSRGGADWRKKILSRVIKRIDKHGVKREVIILRVFTRIRSRDILFWMHARLSLILCAKVREQRNFE